MRQVPDKSLEYAKKGGQIMKPNQQEAGDCGCQIHDGAWLEFCKLHSKAPELLALLSHVYRDLESGYIAQDSHLGEVNRNRHIKAIGNLLKSIS